MRKTVLKDPDLQAQLTSKGWVVLPTPILGPKEIERALAFYNSFPQHHAETGLSFTMGIEDDSYVRRTREELIDITAEKMAEYFDRIKIVSTNFLVKEPGPESVFPVHQDWSFVDENQFSLMDVWIPLTDTDATNGMLGMLTGTQHFTNVRWSWNPSDENWPLPPYLYDSVFFDYMDWVPMKAGQCCVFYTNMVHGSRANLSQRRRVSFAHAVTQAEAPLFHHFALPGNKYETFEADEENFFFKYRAHRMCALHLEGKKPEAKSLGISDWTPFTNKDVMNWIKATNRQKTLTQSPATSG
jgi:hypothetical protein